MYSLEEADRIIKRVSRRFAPSFRGYKDASDLIQDGHIQAIELDKIGKLNENWQGFLTTWLRCWFLNELRSLKQQRRDRGKEVRIDNEKVNPDLIQFNFSRLTEKYAFLSDEAKVILNLFLQTPRELIELTQIYNTREGVNKYLKKVLNWDQKKIENWEEIWDSAEID